MKKLFTLFFIISFLWLTPLSAFAKTVQHLYSVKNSKVSDVKYIADFYTRQNNYIIFSSSDSVSIVYITNEPDEFFTMLFKQNNDNSYFYFYSPSSSPQICNDILKRFRINQHKYSEVRNKQAILDFQTEAVATKAKFELSNNSNKLTNSKYDFSDEAQARYDSVKNAINQSKPTPSLQKSDKNDTVKSSNSSQNTKNGSVTHQVVLPQTPITRPVSTSVLQSNVSMPVVLQSTINTSSLEQSDRISALLKEDLYVNNKLLAKKDSIVYGTAKEAKKAGRAYADGSLQLVFDKMLTTDGEQLSFQSEPIIYEPKNAHRGAKIAGNVIGGIILGVATTALAAAFSSDVNWATTLGVGAAAGAIGGTAMAVSATGEDVEIKEGEILLLKTVISQ